MQRVADVVRGPQEIDIGTVGLGTVGLATEEGFPVTFWYIGTILVVIPFILARPYLVVESFAATLQYKVFL